LVAKNTNYKSLQFNEEVDATNGSVISTSSKTGVVLHSMTTKNRKKYEEINQIEWNIIILKSVSYARRSFYIILYKRKYSFLLKWTMFRK
jgi:hypothetical protein